MGAVKSSAGNVVLLDADPRGIHTHTRFQRSLNAGPVVSMATSIRSQRVAVAAGGTIAVLEFISSAGRCPWCPPASSSLHRNSITAPIRHRVQLALFAQGAYCGARLQHHAHLRADTVPLGMGSRWQHPDGKHSGAPTLQRTDKAANEPAALNCNSFCGWVMQC